MHFICRRSRQMKSYLVLNCYSKQKLIRKSWAGKFTQPSSQNIPRGGIYSLQKITRKFDFRSACTKIPRTTAFTFILTLIPGIFTYKINLFYFRWNLQLGKQCILFIHTKCRLACRESLPNPQNQSEICLNRYTLWVILIQSQYISCIDLFFF